MDLHRRELPMNNYFCGWYFKCQSKTQTLAIIPAFHQSNHRQTCSIQVITKDHSFHVPFPACHLYKNKKEQVLRMDGTIFSKEGIIINIHTDKLKMSGSLTFHDFHPLKYDIMGPFRYVPFMECRHSVFSMRHTVNGIVTINGEQYQFDNAVGYMEGDRGISFPKNYIWTQCFFKNLSIMLSVAEIPVSFLPFCQKKSFTGLIGVIAWNEKEYRFATYLGAKVRKIEDGLVIIEQGNYRLNVQLLEPVLHPLYAPKNGEMFRIIKENTSCRVRYRLENKEKTLFSFETDSASFEYEYAK